MLDSGRSGAARCLQCAITYSQQTGQTLRVSSVTDYVGRKPLQPSRAFYVTAATLLHAWVRW